MMNDSFTLSILFWLPIIVIGATVLLVIMVIFALRGMYLAKQELAEIMRVGKIIPLVKPLRLELGTFPAGYLARIKAIYQRPAALNNKKVPRRVVVLDIEGFTVALTPKDMLYYFVEIYEFRWNRPTKKHAQPST